MTTIVTVETGSHTAEVDFIDSNNEVWRTQTVKGKEMLSVHSGGAVAVRELTDCYDKQHTQLIGPVTVFNPVPTEDAPEAKPVEQSGDMKQYIGVKIVNAKPRQATEEDKRGKHPVGADGYHVVYPDGYESWCPKEHFEEANRETVGMTFGHAVEALKKGFKVARAGWNGKGMHVAYVTVALNLGKNEFNVEVTEQMSFMALKGVNGLHQPWNASQSDTTAEDWVIVE